MPCPGDTDYKFDTQGFERVSGGFASLRGCLPESALTTLAREVLSRMASERVADSSPAAPLPDATIDALCTALIGADPNDAVGQINALRGMGAPIDGIYLSALAPAARRLGDWWDADKASFAQVTIGVSRIYGIMYGLRAEFPIMLDTLQRVAAFAPVPGEDHTLGVSMAADLFRKEGWEIDLKLGLDHDALVRALASADAPIIGLSAGQEESLPALIRLVVALRVSNPRAYLMVAGRFAAQHADTLALTGADAAAGDMPEALDKMEGLWARVVANQTGRRDS